MVLSSVSLSGAVLLAIFFPAVLSCDQNLVVQTNEGPIRGTCNADANVFLGIPFASPPVGPLRWHPPTPIVPWKDTRDATTYGRACVQSTGEGLHPDQTSEDCLFLNVWTPISAPLNPSANLSVMVWIHGGSFLNGAGSLYDGRYLAQDNVIVVTINYRLGPFGYLALPELSEESDTTGFYGILDQRAAMQWVKRNIRNFGGNPDHITLFGESAGAISVCTHLAAPSSANLFEYALMESGFCIIEDYSSRLQQSEELQEKVGCNVTSSSVLACLRAKSTLEIFNALPHDANWFPIVDNVELKQQPIKYLQEGNFNKVPLFAGTNLNEESLFLCPTYANITAAEYEGLVVKQLGQKVGQAVLQLYPVNDYPRPVQALIAVFTDMEFICPTELALESVVAAGVPAYMYSFQYKPGFSVGDCYNVAHSYELPFIWPGLTQLGNYTFTPLEKQLSLKMRDIWATFAHVGHPATANYSWPPFGPTDEYVVIDEVSLTPQTNFREKYCSFWNQPTLA